MAAAVGPGRGGRIQKDAEPCDSTCVHHPVRWMGFLGSQTAQQSNGGQDLGYYYGPNDDSACLIALEQMVQAVTARKENLELLIHVMRSSTDEISNQLLIRLRSGSSTEDLVEFIQRERSEC